MAPKVILLLSLVTLAGCRTAGSFCDLAAPIRLSDATVDVMTDAEIDQVLTHNETGGGACGWRP